jgi:hypothetical protein
MKLSASVNAVFVCAACACSAKKGTDYIDKCSPGTSFDACRNALPKSDVGDGGLETLRVEFMSPASVLGTDGPSLPTVLSYGIYFSTKYDDVLAFMHGELGKGPTHGAVPDLVLTGDRDYWTADDGVWVADRSTSEIRWCGKPFLARMGTQFFPSDVEAQSVKPVGSSSALWRKLGRFVIGHK